MYRPQTNMQCNAHIATLRLISIYTWECNQYVDVCLLMVVLLYSPCIHVFVQCSDTTANLIYTKWITLIIHWNEHTLPALWGYYCSANCCGPNTTPSVHKTTEHSMKGVMFDAVCINTPQVPLLLYHQNLDEFCFLLFIWICYEGGILIKLWCLCSGYAPIYYSVKYNKSSLQNIQKNPRSTALNNLLWSYMLICRKVQ